MHKIFSLTTVAAGAAVGLLVAGVLALVAGAYTKQVVRDQLVPQAIVFPTSPQDLPANLRKYAGERVDTAAEAKAFADDYIGRHLRDVADGKPYSEVSGEFLKDPGNEELAQQRQTLFMGETLRGMLLNAWGWGTVGTVATIAGIAFITIGAILLAIPLLAAATARRSRT